jgi:hypothetical protein
MPGNFARIMGADHVATGDALSAHNISLYRAHRRLIEPQAKSELDEYLNQ